MSRFAPIAIVGRACVLPGAMNPDSLWERVVSGTDLTSNVPADRWGLAPADVLSDRDGDSTDRSWSDRGGYVTGFDDVFDPTGFAIEPNELAGLDPVFLWSLHTARAALRDASATPGDNRRTGAVFGNLSFPSAGMASFASAVQRCDDDALDGADARDRFMSGLPALLLERALGLGAGAMALDAACASSLYAIKLACDRLHDDDADVMLAGAVNCADDLFIHQGFSALNALSPTGRTRPFHSDADGLVPAEGCAFVALRRLEDAERDGDTIHGIIRGIGLSNDGRGRGLLAPAVDGQVRAMDAAFHAAELSPTDVSLLECHATGTSVGDATEISSTARVYAECVDLPIGSLKSNTGHLITAAGVAGLIKVIESMRHEVRPPTLHADRENEAIGASPFRVLHESEPWDRTDVADGVLRAGVSAFGFGGNNAHLIVEEPGSGITAEPTGPEDLDESTPIAIVGIGVAAAGAAGRTDFRDALLTNVSCLAPDGTGRMPDVQLRLADQRFPPNDLDAALAQQLAMLQVADEAIADVGALPRLATGIYVGMGADPEAARFGTRWRVGADRDVCHDELRQARDRIGPPLTAAGVLGTMPNLVANRLNSQYDLAGPSFTVSGEEHSGLDALSLAVRALRSGDVDAALVGAVDLSCDPVHVAALTRVLPDTERPPGDAAVMLVIKRLADAGHDGDTVYAVVCDTAVAARDHAASAADLRLGETSDTDSISNLFGHAHAAAGLLHVAAGAVLLHHRVKRGDVPLISSREPTDATLPLGAGPRTASVHTTGMDGLTGRTALLAEATDHLAPSRRTAPRLHIYSGDDADSVRSALAARRESDAGPARLVIVADGPDQLDERARRADAHIVDGMPAGTGVHFAPAPTRGEVAFVFTAGGAAYSAMGTDLLRALPESLTPLSAQVPLGLLSRWIDDTEHTPLAADYLWGTTLLSQAHAEITLGLLGIEPAAAIGYSSGETNMLFAFGVWTDMNAMRREIDASAMLTSEIAIEFDAVARAWGVPTVDWAVWNVLAPIAEVRSAIAAEDRVHLTLINTERDLVIAGDADACRRVTEALGPHRCRPVGYNLACHVPEVAAAFHQPWLDVHTRDVTVVAGVRFYSNGVGGAYEVSTQSCADAITRQAETTVDFPATLRAAYADGVRVFVEHGPAGACTNFIKETLGDDVVAVHLDRKDGNIEQLFDVCAALVSVGVDVDHRALTERLQQTEPLRTSPEGPVRSFATHPHLDRMDDTLTAPTQFMAPAPTLPPALEQPVAATEVGVSVPGPAVVPAAANALTADIAGAAQTAAALQHQLSALADLHTAFVAQQATIHEQFLATQVSSLDMLALVPTTTAPGTAAPRQPTADSPPVASRPAPPTVTKASPAPARERKALPGPKWEKAQLQIHSSGRISDLFGPRFEPQDHHRVQCRMPEPPLLLADRVTGMVADAGVLGTGTIWTETDVVDGAWYLNGGYMPAGFMIESGQADLMLISYMGIDLINEDERAYRLLGCTMTYHGDLPSPGDTLEYEIRITGHARHGDIRLFFFEYDCVVDGQPRLTVRDAQAGFFDQQELADALGALWTPESGRESLSDDARIDPPVVPCAKSAFTATEVTAFSEGRVLDCFGPGFEWTETHTRTPKIQAGDQLFIDEVTAFDPTGGPWGRGFMRCESRIADDAWFFDGHFKNDPCMPGNFMVEACIEAMSFYLAALGHTTRVDGWRFQPLPEQPFELKCRGEINPQTDRVAYELYVEEVWDGPHPTVICDVLGFVDGKAAFHAHRIGVELVPGWPLTSMPEVLATSATDVTVASDADGFAFDWQAMISCAWGKPSDAFGSMYASFDDTRRPPRLPGEPYHFISRITEIDGDLDACKAGMKIVCEYDVPDDAWYFDENGTDTMPFAVLLEAALQPCGWVASAVGSANGADEDLLFRNLDGTGTIVGELTRTAGTLSTSVTLTSVSRAGGMIVEGFEVECRLGERTVYTMDTVFGFFPPQAFEDQVGLPITDGHRALAELVAGHGEPMIDLATRPARLFDGSARLAGEMLLMLDRVLHIDGGGEAGLGVLVGEKDVDVSEWFFKAHFFQDPVQPGSLGIEALLQLLQYFMLDSGLDTDIADPRFEPMLLGTPMVWKYRGQVTPKNDLITTIMEITEIGVDAVGPFVIGTGSLWCDGLRIYEVENMGMRITSSAPGNPGAAQSNTTASLTEHSITVDLDRQPQLIDHAVDGRPVVPVVFTLEWFARLAAAHRPDLHLDHLSDLRVLAGLVVSNLTEGDSLGLCTAVLDDDATADGGRQLTLALTDAATGRAHYRCTAHLSATPPRPGAPADQPSGAPTDGRRWTSAPYGGDVLFHGPAFHVIDHISSVSDDGIDASCRGVRTTDWPAEDWRSDPALLDGAMQLALLWTEQQLGRSSLPTGIGTVQLFSKPMAGLHTVSLRGRQSSRHRVVCDVEMRSASGDLVARLNGVETHVLAAP